MYAHHKPSGISLQQYGKSPLKTVGECQAKVKINNHVIHITIVVIDVKKQWPFLGKDWMSLLQFDAAALIEGVTQVNHTSEDTMDAEIMIEFADVSRWKVNLEATVTVINCDSRRVSTS